MPKVRSRLKRLTVRHFIRQWRTHRGYTLEQLAEMVGVTHGALSQLERGITNYTEPMLTKLAEALRCEPADLIMRDPTSDTWRNATLIWDQARDLTDAERDQIIELVATVRKFR